MLAPAWRIRAADVPLRSPPCTPSACDADDDADTTPSRRACSLTVFTASQKNCKVVTMRTTKWAFLASLALGLTGFLVFLGGIASVTNQCYGRLPGVTLINPRGWAGGWGAQRQ